jgi:hypothetical protein
VQLKVFDSPEIVTVRSAIPGHVARHVVTAGVPDVLVDLVCYRNRIVLDAELGDQMRSPRA